ncbi:hypothetical protein [Streptomyces sp. NPDC001568]|uniref:hypothetical protein n=1 Tax=Streptomyces sp. NPDC001568 TaxID=3364588 RepID=UPI0036BCCC2D
MRSRTGRVLMAAAAVSAALVMSGCSSQEDAPKVAGGDGSGKRKQQDDNEVRRAWVTCMHGQGRNEVQQDKDGNITIPASGTGDVDADFAAYEKAAKVCDEKVPGIHQAKSKLNQKFADEARAWVACARKNGYAELPDPDARTGILNIPRLKFDGAKWDAVQPACSKLPAPSYSIGE